jgi:hypothetical protein
MQPGIHEENRVMGYIWKNAAIVDQRRTQRPSYTPTRKSGYFMLQRNTIEICCLMEYNMEKRNNNFIMICKTMPNHHLNPV